MQLDYSSVPALTECWTMCNQLREAMVVASRHLRRVIIPRGTNFQLAKLSCGQQVWQQRRSYSTFYDLQSGIHAPVHNEKEVSGYLALSPSVDDWGHDKLETFVKRGIAGAVLQLPMLKQDVGGLDDASFNLDTIFGNGGTPDFTTFLPFTLLRQQQEKIESTPLNFSLMFPFTTEDNYDKLVSDISECVQQSIPTAIVVCDDSEHQQDALMMASGVARLMDDTGGGNHIIVAGERGKHGNDILDLCEELLRTFYSDVQGPTMKSRLIVNVSRNTNDECEEAVGECLKLGINKFIIDEERIDWLGHFVESKGGGYACTFKFQ